MSDSRLSCAAPAKTLVSWALPLTLTMAAGCVISDESPPMNPPVTMPEACAAIEPGPRLLRLLSHKEYDATIHDLFGIEAHWGESFVPHTVVGGFSNNADALTVSTLLADQMRRAAESIAAQVMTQPWKLFSCDPAQADPKCIRAFLTTFGPRVFRRPLTVDEIEGYVALVQSIASTDGNAKGVETLLSTMLQSPHFLYRSELGDETLPALGGRVRLNAYEIASELSYLFWGTMPDAELFAEASADKLQSAEDIQAQVVRLLADPRSDALLDRFIEEWLNVDHLDTLSKDLVMYPRWTQKNRDDLRTELRMFVRHVVREGTATLPELLDARYSFVNKTLAQYYGLPSKDIPLDQFVKVDVSGLDRAGLLTQASVMSVHGRPRTSSPVQRGKLIRERLQCQTLVEPPPGVVTQLPPPSLTLTTRERYAAHSTEPGCRGCHAQLDPLGFAFEHFDGIGAYRSDENGIPIDASGELTGQDGPLATFDGAGELASILAYDPDVHACYARHWIRYGYGLRDDGPLQCLSAKIAAEYGQSRLGVVDVLVLLTQTPHFVERSK